RKLITYWSEVNGFYKSYAPEISIAICFSCNQLVYTGKRTKNIGNYNHIGMEKHWASHWYIYDNEYALHQYELWMFNAIKKVKRAREIGRKILACRIIQRKWLEIFFRPEG
ncbi:11080_t:CDS:2, partial [Entrophospora sp. SA101]